jgi:glycosyltransferase involved in cell wall biosynthesis
VAVKLANAIITPTETVKEELCAHLKVKPAKVTAIHEAPRQSFGPVSRETAAHVRKRLGIEDDFLLFVGTLEPRKNLATLLKAFAQIIHETSLRPQLVVAGGEGWLMDETAAIMRGEDICERLCLTGYLHDDDLRALYSSCRAFIYPSLYEGFGLPPLEAMASGAPVIASRAPALPESLGEAAILVDPLDVEGLARSIVDLINDGGRREKLIEQSRAHAAKFSWERTAELTYEVYRRVRG